MSNNTTQTNIVVGAAITGGLLFFGFLTTNTCTSPFSKEASANTSVSQSPKKDLITTTHSSDEIEKLTKKYDTELKLKNSTIADLNKQLATALNSQPAKNEESVTIPSQNPPSSNANLADNADTLKAKLLEQSNKFQAEIKEHEAQTSQQITTLQDELKSLHNQRETLENKLKTLNLQHQEEIQKLKALTTNSGDSDKLLQKKINDLIAQLNSNKEKSNNLEQEIKTFRNLTDKQKATIIELSAQINQFKAQKNMFVKSTNDLPGNAKALFDSLKALEGNSPEQIKSAYTKLTQQTKFEAKARIKFRSGKATISAADEAKINELINTADDNAYFLIVGYADKSGNAASNKKLSSQRATNVAKSLSTKAKGFQAAQAVYLGQTDRFGNSSENRVVEIWQIK